MKEYKLSSDNYKCYYNYIKGKKTFLFFNGLAGVKDFFYDFKKFKKNKDGLLLIDFPGFGKSKFYNTPKKIIPNHLNILKKILVREKINNITLVIFSLSTVYIPGINKDNFFLDKIKKVIFLDPSFFKEDLDWSISIFKKTRLEFDNYIDLYKKNLRKIFPLGLKNKNKNLNRILCKMNTFDNEVLYKLNKESINIVRKKKLHLLFKEINKIYLFPCMRKLLNNNKKNLYRKKYYIKNSKHYIFLDNPKATYSLISKNG